MNTPVRVRFAPSPTGPLHVGGARTALFNWLFARKHGGRFLLRIEDTDPERSKGEYIEDITSHLRWLGLEWDEEIYYQSERSDIYERYRQALLKTGNVYYCFCQPEELEQMREYQLSRGEPPHYTGKCRDVSPEEANERLNNGERAVMRLHVPERRISFRDEIRGTVEFDGGLIGDFAILRVTEEGSVIPLYNFAAVCDDYEMAISHVIRGEDHISNTPRQILLYEALGLKPPAFAHLPLILGQDKSKMSKRHGAVTVEEYHNKGYLPDALVNFLALLGWSPGNDREIMSRDELTEAFSLERCQKGGSVFNIEKLTYMNGVYIRNTSLEHITELCIPHLAEANLIAPAMDTEQYPPAYGGQQLFYRYTVPATEESISEETLQRIIGLYHERLKYLAEISELVDFFFVKMPEYETELLYWKDMSSDELVQILEREYELLDNIEAGEWNANRLKEILMHEADEIVGDRGKTLWPPRVAVTGKKASAQFFDIAEILGKRKTLSRISNAIDKVNLSNG